MSTALEKLHAILSKHLPEEQIYALMSELTIAIGANSVAIAGDAPGAVTITGNQSFMGNNNHITIYESTNPDEIVKQISSLLQSLQLKSTQISLLGIETKFKRWQVEQNKYFLDSLESSEKSSVAFNQIINFNDESTKFIKRQALFERLDNWHLSWNQSLEILTITGDEGDGKTWGMAYWLEQKIKESKDFPVVIFLPSVSVTHQDPLELLCQTIATRLRLPIESCRIHLEDWINKSTESHPVILLVLDGINERHEFLWWRKLINSLNIHPWKEKIAVLITCRQEYWHRFAPQSFQNMACDLDPYNDEELTEALKSHNLNRSEISKSLLPLLSKPRYFDLMIRHRDRIAASGDITVQRLIYEDWKDRYERKTNTPLTDDGFQSLIRKLASKQLENLKTRKLDEIELNKSISSLANNSEILNEIISGGIVKVKRGRFEVVEEYLIHGFGLLLVEELEEAVEKGETRLNEVIAKWIEPHAAMDIKALICHAASLITLEDVDLSLEVKVALLDAWVSSQNPSEEIEKDFIAYLPLAPEAYIQLAEIVWSDAIDNPWAQELLMSAFKRWLEVRFVQFKPSSRGITGFYWVIFRDRVRTLIPSR